MTPVSAPHGGDISGMTRSGEPVVNGSTNAAALHRRIARPVVTGDEEHDAIAARNRLLEAAVDRCPGRIEIHPVKVEHEVGL